MGSPLGSILLLSEISKISKSLYILNLLSYLFNLAFYVNHYAGNTNVLSIGAYGVGFSVKLLNKEVKLSAYRLGRVQHRAELGEMALKPYGFLVYGGLLSKKSCL